MPVCGLVVGIALVKQTFPVRFRTVDACNLTTIIKSQSILNVGPQEVYLCFIAIIYTNKFAKIRKVFTERIYLFDSGLMERLKSAVQKALTKRKLSIAFKKERLW